MARDPLRGAQIALPLPPAPQSPEMARIVVGNANAAAVDALAQTQGWPYGTAILFGPPRSGKSLFARWFADSGAGVVVDDADLMDETALFHRWNRAREEGTPLLLTAAAREDGEDWVVTLPDLGSRLRPALRLDIDAPDDEMMVELLAAHAEARTLPIGEEALRYLASRSERSHLCAERLIAAIDRISLERKSAPGAPVLRQALEETQGAGAQGPHSDQDGIYPA